MYQRPGVTTSAELPIPGLLSQHKLIRSGALSVITAMWSANS